MKALTQATAAAAAAALACGAAFAHDHGDHGEGEKKPRMEELVFPLDEAPRGALEAVQAAAPDATFTGVDVEVEDGVVTLEFQGLRADGQAIEIDVAQGWAVLEIEEIISMDAVPEAVRETLSLAMPGFAPTSVEKSMRGETVVYEFEGANADGLAIDVEVQAEGESIVILDDDET